MKWDISFYHLLWVVPFSQDSSHHPVFIIHNFQDPNLNLHNLPQLHPGKGTQPLPLHITNVTVGTHRKSWDFYRGPRVIQTARWGRFGQLEFFCWYKQCVLWCFCVLFFFWGGEELKVVETGNVGKKPKDDERCISMMYGFESCCEVLFNGFELIEAIPRPLITTDAHWY